MSHICFAFFSCRFVWLEQQQKIDRINAQNAVLSAMPYLAMLLLSYFFSFLSGILERKNCVPLKYSRKVFNTIGKIYEVLIKSFDSAFFRVQKREIHNATVSFDSINSVHFETVDSLWLNLKMNDLFFCCCCCPFLGHWIPMCALIALGYVTASEKDLAIFLLIIAVGINSSTYLGFQVNVQPILPFFSIKQIKNIWLHVLWRDNFYIILIADLRNKTKYGEICIAKCARS